MKVTALRCSRRKALIEHQLVPPNLPTIRAENKRLCPASALLTSRTSMPAFLRNIVSLLLTAALLSACAVQSQGGMVNRNLAEADPAKMGMVVGSFGKYVADKNFPSQSLLLRRLESKDEDVTVRFAGNM